MFLGAGTRKKPYIPLSEFVNMHIKHSFRFRPFSCHAKLIKTTEEGKLIDYILLSFVAG